MIQIIDTSMYQRHIHNTNAWVETDIVDASGHYKHYAKYDTVKIAVDPSLAYEYEHWTRPNTHLYVDPSIGERAKWEYFNLYSTDGSLDRKKFPF